MLFDRVLRLGTFPTSVMDAEVAYYKTQLKPFGLPLDSRGPLTKTDWTSWIGAMSSDVEFATELFDFLLQFVLTSPSRGVPFSDWYATDDGRVLGFRARPVQGGLFAKYLLTSRTSTSSRRSSSSSHTRRRTTARGNGRRLSSASSKHATVGRHPL